MIEFITILFTEPVIYYTGTLLPIAMQIVFIILMFQNNIPKDAEKGIFAMVLMNFIGIFFSWAWTIVGIFLLIILQLELQ